MELVIAQSAEVATTIARPASTTTIATLATLDPTGHLRAQEVAIELTVASVLAIPTTVAAHHPTASTTVQIAIATIAHRAMTASVQEVTASVQEVTASVQEVITIDQGKGTQAPTCGDGVKTIITKEVIEDSHQSTDETPAKIAPILHAIETTSLKTLELIQEVTAMTLTVQEVVPTVSTSNRIAMTEIVPVAETVKGTTATRVAIALTLPTEIPLRSPIVLDTPSPVTTADQVLLTLVVGVTDPKDITHM